MKSKDYVPRNDADFTAWALVLLDYLLENLLRFNIPQASYDGLRLLLDVWLVKYKTASTPSTRTSAAIIAKDEARVTFVKALRGFIIEHLTYSSLVTDEDRRNMGIPVHKTTRTPAPVPVDIPDLVIKTPSPGVIVIYFKSSSATGKAKPDGVHCIVIYYAILDHPPVDWSELIHSVDDTKSPCQLTFTGEQRGKTLYIAACWENTRGEKGNISDIQSCIVP
jgi:hypothetical protein